MRRRSRPRYGWRGYPRLRLDKYMPDSGGRRLGGNGCVGVAGHENNGSIDVAQPQEAGEVKSAHARHLVVEYEAIRFSRRDPVQERLRTAEGVNGEAFGFQKEPQRDEYISIIVDDT